MEYIIVLGAFQAFIALALFVVGQNRKPADNLLNWMLICLATHLSIKFIIYVFSNNDTIKLGFNTFIDLAYGPLLWMYARKIKNNTYHRYQQFLLLLPSFIAAIAYVFIVIKLLAGSESAISLINQYNSVTSYLIIPSFIVFSIMSLRIAKQLPAFWQTERQLIQRIAFAFILLSSTWIIVSLGELTGMIHHAQLAVPLRITAYIFFLAISIIIIHYRLVSYKLLSSTEANIDKIQPEVQPINSEPSPSDLLSPATITVTDAGIISTNENRAHAPLRKPIVQEDQQVAIISSLVNIMRTQKIFTDPDLTLEKLAAAVNIPRNHVSETLNHHLSKSFYQFVNEYRVEEVINLLDKHKGKRTTPNILSLAFEAGFQSKTTFNQYFKKTTGQTPSEYLKKPTIPSSRESLSRTYLKNTYDNNRLTV